MFKLDKFICEERNMKIYDIIYYSFISTNGFTKLRVRLNPTRNCSLDYKLYNYQSLLDNYQIKETIYSCQY